MVIAGAVGLSLSRALYRVGPYTVGRNGGPPPGLYSASVFSPFDALMLIAIATLALALAREKGMWGWALGVLAIISFLIFLKILHDQIVGGLLLSSEGSIFVFDAILVGGIALLAYGCVAGRSAVSGRERGGGDRIRDASMPFSGRESGELGP